MLIRPLNPRSLFTAFQNVNHTEFGFVLGKITFPFVSGKKNRSKLLEVSKNIFVEL